MNYPYGQGFPGPPEFPQQPGMQPPVFHAPSYGPTPGYPNAYPPMPPKGPRSAAAFFARILALLGGLFMLAFSVLVIFIMFTDHDFDALGFIICLFLFMTGSALLVGTILLWRRKLAGRRFVVSACAAAMVLFLVAVVGDLATSKHPDIGVAVGYVVPLVVFPLLTILLVTRPSTKAWIQAKQTPTAAQQIPTQQMPPQPHWP